MEFKKFEKYLIYFGIPIICILGVINHFIFDLIDSIPFLGIFFPINESVWEHLKLSFYPILIYWFIGHFCFRKKINYDTRRWFISMVVSILISVLFVLIMHYTIDGIFGKVKPAIDISIYVISIGLGQIIGYNCYVKVRYSNEIYYISCFMLILLFICFIVFTYFQPKIPIFYDELNKVYGFKK